MKFNEWESIPYFKDKGDSILDIVFCAMMLFAVPGCYLTGNLCGFYTGLGYVVSTATYIIAGFDTKISESLRQAHARILIGGLRMIFCLVIAIKILVS